MDDETWLDDERIERLGNLLLDTTDRWGVIENHRYILGRKVEQAPGRYVIETRGNDFAGNLRITLERI